MAQYWEDWSGSTISDEPTGWTKRWVGTGVSYTVESDASGFAPAGRRLKVVTSSSSRNILTLDAVDADADRATIQIAMLVRWITTSGSMSLVGASARASGSGGSENGVTGLGATSTGVKAIRRNNYASGTGTLANTSANLGWTNTGYYWLVMTLSGTSYTLTLAPQADPGAIIHTMSDTVDITGAGWAGLFAFTTGHTAHVLAVGIGTGGDAAPMSAPGDAEISFSGTIPAQSFPEGSAITPVDFSGYFSGDLTPFTYSVTTGTLPAGLALDEDTCILSGTPTTAASAVSIVITGTDTGTNDAQSNAFNITITDVDTDAPTLSSPTGTETGATTASGTVSTNEGNGTLYAVVTTSATLPGEEDIRAGTGAVYDTSQSVSAAGVQAVSASGLTAATTYYWHFLHDDAAANPSNIVTSASFTTDAASVAMTIVTDIDAGNASSSLSIITDPESTSPVVFIDHRVGASRASVAGWRHLYFAVENAEGKTPVFKLSRASRQYDTTPPTAWIPMMTTDPDDYTSWVQAPSRTLVTGSPNTIEFQFADPLPAGRVYISTHIVGGVAQMGALVDDLLTNHASIASIPPSAGAGGVYATSPSETDDISRAVGGQPQYAVKLAFGGSTNDGGPKRKLVLGTHIHGAGEAASWGAFRYMLDYIMSSADAAAVALRANWDLYIYGPICPNALYGGASRWGWRSAEDPNRDWPDTSFYDELTATKAAIIEDTGGSADAMLVWHTWGSATSLFNYGANTQDQNPGTIHPAADAFLTLGATIFGSSPNSISADTDNTGSWWGRSALGAAVSFEAEVGMSAVTAPATQQFIGENWAKTLAAVDAAGEFWAPSENASGEVSALSLAAPEGSAATTTAASGALAGITPAAPAGSSATSAAGSGDIAPISITAPNGDASTETETFASGSIASIALAAPAGAALPSAPASGALASLSLTAPNGDASTEAEVFASGALAAISLTAPSGTASTVSETFASGAIVSVGLTPPEGVRAVETTASGAVSGITLVAVTGTADTLTWTFAEGALPAITLTAPSGTHGVDVAGAGAMAGITIVAPSGHGFNPAATAFDFRNSVFARMPAHYDVFARIQ